MDILDSFYFGFGLESSPLGSANGVFIDEVLIERKSISISNYTYESQGWDGTSMAAPYVSGVAGLILSVNPSLTFEEIKDIILKSVDHVSSLAGITLTGGRLNASNAMGYIIPPAPSGLIATPFSGSQIDLAWADNSLNESGFRIERKKGSVGTNVIATVGANITAYSDKGLSSGTTYFYRIKAYNNGGESLPSEEAIATTFQSTTDDDNGGRGGGCSVGMVQNYQAAIADTLVLFMPLVAVWIIIRFKRHSWKCSRKL